MPRLANLGLAQSLLALLLGLALPVVALGDRAAERVLAEARLLAESEDWAGLRDLLSEHLARSPGEASAHELYGRALAQLGEPDRAAHHLARAFELFEKSGDSRGARGVERDLKRVDPLHGRRQRLQRDATSKLSKAAEKLFELGHPERAREILERLAPIAAGKDAGDVHQLLGEIEKASSEVDLDAAGDEREEGGTWPLVTFESDHYVLEANLEEELVALVAETMDDIHGYYVTLYFDGDAKAASAAKATIRIHPTRDSMLSGWSGSSAPEGWWSPGENRVTCYDTRTTTGSLDWMLETLFHEASHQFMTLLERKGGSAPAWLNEGTSSFFEGATAMADHRVLWPDAAIKRLMSLRAMLGGSMDSPTLEEVLGYGGPGSYPPNYYAWGWGLVYFLQQYEDPTTLEYVYRPLYSRYRERITSRGGDSRELFDEIFLGDDSPLGHGTLEEFERDWREWILEGVAPLHTAPEPERRELRLARATRYEEAAVLAAEDRKAPVAELDLLSRALGHLEYVRERLDGELREDVTLLGRQAGILERLERPAAAAPLVQRMLELADEGAWSPGEEELLALEERLERLDRRNYALRRAESTRRGLVRTARNLLEDYSEAEPSLPLRSYTFASALGAALADGEVLQAAAETLQVELRDQGFRFGQLRSLASPPSAWTTNHEAGPDRFRSGDARVELAAVRAHGRLNTAVELSEEYELRATFLRDGELHRSTCHGLVVAGVPRGDWLVFGLLKSGKAGLWRLELAPGGGVTTKKLETFYLEPRPADDQDLDVAVEVSADGRLSIRVGDCAPLEARVPPDLPRGRHAGIYAKDGTTILVDPVVELY